MTVKREGAIVFEANGAFYNPKMMLCRDIGVAMTSALGIDEYLDALSASGIRGMRVAREVGTERVTLNDFDPRAVQLMQRNVARNDLDCMITDKDANVLMHQEHFQAIDLDPFGSPSPYLSAASRSARSYLFITATDTAPLCGAHLKSGIRKYMARPCAPTTTGRWEPGSSSDWPPGSWPDGIRGQSHCSPMSPITMCASTFA